MVQVFGSDPTPTDTMTNYQKAVAAALGGVVVLFTAAAFAAPENAEVLAALKELSQAEAVEVADVGPYGGRYRYRY